MSERVTFRHIATAAGVSTATVSLALRDSERIAPATRAKVHAAAALLGYRPDPLIAALAARRRGVRVREPDVIAYLTAYPTREGWRRNRFAPAAHAGACARAAGLGYRVEHFWLREPRMTPRRLADILLARGILGVCLAPFPEPVAELDFPWARFCTAALGHSLTGPALHRAGPHHLQGMQLVLTRLRERGYRRIGVALGRRVNAIVCENWLAAALLFQRAHGRASVSFLVYEESDRAAPAAFLAQRRPDALVVSDLALIDWLRETGVCFPEELGVVPLERHEGFACLDQKPAQVGAAAIDLVVGLLQRGETGLPADPRTVQVQGAWIDGPSIRSVA